MANRPYAAGRLEPIAGIGDKLLLLGPGGVIAEGQSQSETWFEVVFCEPVFGLGAKGTTLLWTQAGSAPAGYSLPASGAASGTINAGGQMLATPSIFQMSTHQLLQFRWAVRIIGGLNSNVIDDIDVQFAAPAGAPRFTVLGGQSRWNSRFQAPEPSDTAAGPAQGANQAAPAAAGYSPGDYLNLTEVYLYEQTYTPQWTLINNGANALNVSGSAIGVDVWGFRMDVMAVPPQPEWASRWLLGKQRMCPPDFVVVPISGRTAGTPVTS